MSELLVYKYTELLDSTNIAYYTMILSLIYSPTSVLIKLISFILFGQFLPYNSIIAYIYISVNYYLTKLSSRQLNNREFPFGYLKEVKLFSKNKITSNIVGGNSDNFSYVACLTNTKRNILQMSFHGFIARHFNQYPKTNINLNAYKNPIVK